jgi:hypothetical protein
LRVSSPSARLACKSSRGAIKPETDRLTTTTTRVGTQKEKVIHLATALLKAAVVLPGTILLTVWN